VSPTIPGLIKQWLWGYLHLSPYSLVSFHGTAGQGNPFADAYVAKDGVLLISSCAASSVDMTSIRQG
jgi:hypothetical protein